MNPAASPLADIATTTANRAALTALLVGITFVLIVVVRRLRQPLADRIGPSPARSAVAITIAVLFGTLGIATATVWGQDELLFDAVTDAIPREQIPRVILTVGIFVGTHFVSVFIKQLYSELLGDSNAVSEHQREVTYRVTQLVLYTTAVLVVFGVWDQNLGGLLIGAGFAGIVLGMAARQTLGNVLSGFVLMFSRPFEVGDWIEIDSDTGIVTDITIINTRIRTFDGEYIIFPNNVVRDQAVTNRSETGRLRIEVEVGVDYDNDTEQARATAREAVDGIDRLLTVPTPSVIIKEYGDSAIVLGVRGWIDNPSSQRRWRAKTDMIEAITAAFEREGIKIPFPQRELSDRPEDTERARGQQREMEGPPAPDGRGDPE